MARRLRPVELDFITSAPVRLVFAAGISAEPDAIYHALAKETEEWTTWYRGVTSARPLPSGRDIALLGALRFRETELAAEQPIRYAYRVDVTNAPGVRAVAEEWQVAPLTSGGSRVQWSFAAEAVAPVGFLLGCARPVLRRSFRNAMRALDRRLAARVG